MSFKPSPRKRAHSDVPLQVSFANGFAILSQTDPSASRRLTKCYMPAALRIVITTFIVILASSCATTKVHLFTEALETTEIVMINEILTANGYAVVHNSLPIPEGIEGPSLVYSPLHRNLNDVERLRDIFASAGLAFDLEPVSRGNHFYTGTNVGLYPKAFVAGRAREMSVFGKELFGECPIVDATLALNKDLTFEVKFIAWNEREQSETHRSEYGVWWQSDETVVLAFLDQEYSFNMSKFSKSTDYAKIDGLRLKSTIKIQKLEQCDFVYTEMDPW
jgi:hypothetical protein